MSEQRDELSGDVEQLAEAVCNWDEAKSSHAAGEKFPCAGCLAVARAVARAVVGSDWLAAHDAEVAAQAWDECYRYVFAAEGVISVNDNPYRVAGHTPEEQ